MDRILSARIDDAVYRKISDLSTRMHTSKKSVIEMAIQQFGEHIEQDAETTVFDRTCGIWNRNETPAETIDHVRRTFHNSMTRYRR
jgi:hypothetical protein